MGLLNDLVSNLTGSKQTGSLPDPTTGLTKTTEEMEAHQATLQDQGQGKSTFNIDSEPRNSISLELQKEAEDVWSSIAGATNGNPKINDRIENADRFINNFEQDSGRRR